MFSHLSLFSGIGGIDLAAHACGFRTAAFVEREPFCQKVLAKNFPGVPIFDDITTFDPRPFRGRIDLLSGGFPCQDISIAGKGAGLEGERSGLWYRMLDVISAVRPRFVLAENVRALHHRGIDTVLCGLEAAGYTCGAFVVGVDDVRGPHQRKRVFIVGELADADRQRFQDGRAEVARRVDSGGAGRRATGDDIPEAQESSHVAHGYRLRQLQSGGSIAHERGRVGNGSEAVADAPSRGIRRRGAPGDARQPAPCGEVSCVVGNAHDAGRGEQRGTVAVPAQFPPIERSGGRQSQPGVCGATDGVPGGMDRPFGYFPGWPARPGEAQHAWESPRLATGVPDRTARLKALGNAVCPLQVYPVLRAIADRLQEESQ